MKTLIVAILGLPQGCPTIQTNRKCSPLENQLVLPADELRPKQWVYRRKCTRSMGQTKKG